MKQVRKKLIEVAIPLEAINRASAREKSIRHGHPSTLHLWWARRPLAACRAVLFAQMVDDPSEYVEELLEDPKVRAQAEVNLEVRTAAWEKQTAEANSNVANLPKPTLEDCAAEIERKRLFKIIEDMVIWENSANEEVLERACAEVRRSCGNEIPPVFDPFSGGASIPLEAQRIGMPAYGSDLNPVAVLVGKAMLDFPYRFKSQPPVHSGLHERNHYRNTEGLSEDIRHYGKIVRERAKRKIGQHYPEIEIPDEQGGGNATVVAWIWCRTVPSPDPAFANVHVPLASSFVLNQKSGKEVWVEPQVDKSKRTIQFHIRYGGKKSDIDAAKTGTKLGRANFRCLFSGSAITADYIKSVGKAGELGQTLVAVIAEGGGGRKFVAPNDLHISKALSSDLSKIAEEYRSTFLSGATPEKLTGGTCYGYGLNTWGKLFTDRQVTALKTFCETLHEIIGDIERDALAAGLDGDQRPLREKGIGAKAYSEAVAIYLSFAIDRLADGGSTIATWSSGGFIRFTFARQAIPMTWDFAECNFFSSSTGSFSGAIDWIANAVGALQPRNIGTINQQPAQQASVPSGAVVSTDPPYYDNIAYADLSDFFYVWLRNNIKNIFPELAGTLTVPKGDELVASAYRHGGRTSAEKFFLAGMTDAISVLAQQSSSKFPAAIYYAFKQSEIDEEGLSSTGWATFLQAIISAGYSVVGTWPVRTERAARTVASGTNALANSVVLVCRKKGADSDTISRAEFIRALKRELPPSLSELQSASIAPADMPQSAIGPGMGVFSRYAAVIEGDDSPMTVKTALQLINRELDEYLGGIEGEFDADTRFAITWFEQNGMDAGEYGTANNIAQARGISVDNVKHAGIVASGGGSVRLLGRDELDEDWDPATDRHLTVWECCQYLIRALEDHGEYEAALLMKRMGPDHAEAVKDLAYCLYDIAGNKRQDAKEATSYNGLIAVWPDLTAQAAAISDEVLASEQFALNV